MECYYYEENCYVHEKCRGFCFKKRFPLETYRYLVSAQRRTKQYDCYAENFMNDSNKEYERLCSLASRIRSYLQEKKEVTADF